MMIMNGNDGGVAKDVDQWINIRMIMMLIIIGKVYFLYLFLNTTYNY